MNVQQALSMIHAPKGVTSIISALFGGDMDSVKSQNAVDASLSDAKKKLASAKKARAECKSDAAYWGYQGDISYWSAVVDILMAAELVGPDNLPDVAPPKRGIVVMDACDKVEQFGKDMLDAARRRVKS